MLVYLTDSAFTYMTRFRLGPRAFSGLLALNIAAFAVCPIINAPLLNRIPASRIVAAACCIELFGAGAFLAHATLTTPSLPVVIMLIMVCTGVQGMILGNAGARFLSHFPGSRATAADVAGSFQFLVAGIMGTGLGILHTGTLATPGAAAALCALLALLAVPLARPTKEASWVG